MIICGGNMSNCDQYVWSRDRDNHINGVIVLFVDEWWWVWVVYMDIAYELAKYSLLLYINLNTIYWLALFW